MSSESPNKIVPENAPADLLFQLISRGLERRLALLRLGRSFEKESNNQSGADQ